MTTTAVETEAQRSGRPWGLIGLIGAVLVVLLILSIGMKLSGAGPVNAAPAPDFTLQTFDGETIRLSDFRGQPVVINFWASWCVPCEREAPILESTWRKYRDAGVVFIGIDYVDTEPAARAFLDKYDITYRNGPDVGSRISDAYRIQGVPETFFVDRKGVVRDLIIGELAREQLEAGIALIRAK